MSHHSPLPLLMIPSLVGLLLGILPAFVKAQNRSDPLVDLIVTLRCRCVESLAAANDIHQVKLEDIESCQLEENKLNSFCGDLNRRASRYVDTPRQDYEKVATSYRILCLDKYYQAFEKSKNGIIAFRAIGEKLDRELRSEINATWPRVLLSTYNHQEAQDSLASAYDLKSNEEEKTAAKMWWIEPVLAMVIAVIGAVIIKIFISLNYKSEIIKKEWDTVNQTNLNALLEFSKKHRRSRSKNKELKQAENRIWEIISRRNTERYYKIYLNNFPRGRFSELCQEQLLLLKQKEKQKIITENLEKKREEQNLDEIQSIWKRAELQDSVLAYMAIREYPALRIRVETRIKQKVAALIKAGNIEECRLLVRQYPAEQLFQPIVIFLEGLQKEEDREKLKARIQQQQYIIRQKEDWEKANRINNVEAFIRFSQDHPQALQKALRAIERQVSKEKRGRLKTLLAKYPEESFTPIIEQQLQKLAVRICFAGLPDTAANHQTWYQAESIPVYFDRFKLYNQQNAGSLFELKLEIKTGKGSFTPLLHPHFVSPLESREALLTSACVAFIDKANRGFSDQEKRMWLNGKTLRIKPGLVKLEDKQWVVRRPCEVLFNRKG